MSFQNSQMPGNDSPTRDEIVFTKELFQKLKDTYTVAKEAGVDRFVFEGRELVPDYAKYLIEHLENKFNEV
ncbi:hypothetical protein KAR91_37540 [Candidatus Pacearchaeota archaeon]|nr:hypothetical protein [Candidatus Pacearchaeota archaeon]